MEKIIRKFQKYTNLIPPLQKWLNKKRQIAELEAWQEKPRALPLPHLLKQDILKGYVSKYNLSILVETGTYRGEMRPLRFPFGTFISRWSGAYWYALLY